MIRAGAILLSLWTGINLLLGLAIMFMLLVLHKNAPASVILYGDTRAIVVDPRALATINAFAVIFNACAAALCTLSLVVIWIPLIRKQSWASWALSGSLSFLQAAGFAGDYFWAQGPARKYRLFGTAARRHHVRRHWHLPKSA